MKSKFIVTSAIIAAGLVAIGAISIFYPGEQLESSETYGISSVKLEKQLGPESDFLIIDVRDTDSYMSNHIKGSAVDDLTQEETLDKRINTIHSRIPEIIEHTTFVVTGDGGRYPTDAIVKKMNESGLETYYLEGGIHNWNRLTVNKESPVTISSDELMTAIQNNQDVYLLDVRQPEELDVTKISGSINIPLVEIFESQNIKEIIPDDKPVIVICGSGNRATIATYELAKYNIDFQILEGGMKSWNVYLEENSLDKI